MVGLPLQSLAIPLREDDGNLRVGATRVTLDSVVGTFNQGASAEEIVMKFPGLVLSEVYAVLSYYLQHRIVIDSHLAERAHRADQWEAAARSMPGAQGVRERLLARRNPGA